MVGQNVCNLLGVHVPAWTQLLGCLHTPPLIENGFSYRDKYMETSIDYKVLTKSELLSRSLDSELLSRSLVFDYAV